MRTSLHRLSFRQPAVLAWLRLARVFRKIDTLSERFFRAQGLNLAQFDILAHLGATESMTQQELAGALLVTKGNISQLIDRMEGGGLVCRQHEGRVNHLSLTDQGRALFNRLVPAQEQLIADLFSPLTLAEQAELLRLLRKLDHHIER